MVIVVDKVTVLVIPIMPRAECQSSERWAFASDGNNESVAVDAFPEAGELEI